MEAGNLLRTSRMLGILVLGLGFLGACGKDASLVETALADYCRSRSEGQYQSYLDSTGGELLLAALRDQGTQQRMVTQGSNLAHEGIVLIETYVTSVELDGIKRQAVASYLEKFGKGLKTWAVHHQSQLEYIDQRWRVISDRTMVAR